MNRDLERSQRGPVDFVLFGMAFVGFVIGAIGVVITSVPAVVTGFILLGGAIGGFAVKSALFS